MRFVVDFDDHGAIRRSLVVIGEIVVGIFAALLIFVSLVALNGCPKPGPAPVTPPDASDAARPPSCRASCSTACAHLVTVAPQASMAACLTLCGDIAAKDPGYPCCVAAAANASAADNCDPGTAVQAGKPVNGR